MKQKIGILPQKRVVLLALLTVLLLVAGTGLFFPGFLRGILPLARLTQPTAQAIVPTLKLSTSKAKVGQAVTLHIVHFTPSTSVLVTHDVGVAVQTNRGSSTITVGPDGAASVTIRIDKSWQPGSHIIGVEDTTTRYTMSVTIHIAA